MTLDIVLRYRPVMEVIRATLVEGRSSPRPILEVGSGPRGLAELVPGLRVVVSDLRFSSRPPVADAVLATGTALPFQTNAFPIVAAVDVLEHVPPQFREAFVRELYRVAGSRLILTFPSGQQAVKWERVYNALFRLLFRHNSPWIAEHMAYGLPDPAVVVQALDTSVPVRQTGNTNLYLWLPIMLMSGFLEMTVSKIFGWRWAAGLWPLLKLLNFGRRYRAILVITK